MGTINSHPPTANSAAFKTSPTTTTVMGPSTPNALPQTRSIVELKNSTVDSTPCSPSMAHSSGLEHEETTASPAQTVNDDMLVNTTNGSQIVSNDHHQDSPGAEIQLEAGLPIKDEKEDDVTDNETASTSTTLVARQQTTSTLPLPDSTANGATSTATATATGKEMNSNIPAPSADPTANMLKDDGVLSAHAEEAVDRQKPAPAVQTPSVPPHLRKSASQPPMEKHQSSEDRSYSYNEPPSGPRSQHRPYQNGPHSYGESERVARLNAQVMRLQNDLNTERKKNSHMRASIEAEQQKATEAAVSNLLASVFTRQTEALKLKEEVREQERALRHRAKWIQQLEAYLAEGQKQLKNQLEAQGIRPMAAVERAQIFQEAELSVQRRLANMQANLATQTEQLQHREEIQLMREEHYKERIRETLMAELRANFLAQEKADEIAESAYNDGYTDGNAAGSQEVFPRACENNFIKGYIACRQSQAVLEKLKKGLVAADDAEVAGLLDVSNDDGLYGMGVRIGKWEAERQAREESAVDEEEGYDEDDEPVVDTAPPTRHAVAENTRNKPTSVRANSSGDSSNGAHGKKHVNGTKAMNGVNGTYTSSSLQSSIHAIHSSKGKEQNLIDLD